jgi:hypothetical protein
MRVPKMVKNGQSSVLHNSNSVQEGSCSKRARIDTKPKTFLKSWKANKNYFRPISEQACALCFENDDYHSAVARDVTEAQKLVEVGFEYVCDFSGVKLFTKRK